AAALSMPAFSLTRTLMTIDAPYTCCWAWALVLGHRAFFHDSRWAWPLLGCILGLGVLAKYTMALWIPSAILFLFCTKEYRPALTRPGFWWACAIAAVFCLPIVWWNWRNDWVTFRHVGGLAGVATASNKPFVSWLGPLRYVAGQFGLLLGV